MTAQEALVNNSVQGTILSIVSDHIRERQGREVTVDAEESFEALRINELDRREIVMRVEAAFGLTREIHENEILTPGQLIAVVKRIDAKEKCDG